MNTKIMECKRHGLTEHVFYSGRYRCKKCYTWYNAEKRKRFKKELINYKGGKCEICGYDKCQSALEFHHLDKKQKKFSISETAFSKSMEELKKEADKCILVCANCHREIHEKLNEERLNNYSEYLNDSEHRRYAFNKIDKEKVKEYIENGKKQKDIAAEFNVSLSTLKRFLLENGLTKKNPLK